jgi:hypothetical protein
MNTPSLRLACILAGFALGACQKTTDAAGPTGGGAKANAGAAAVATVPVVKETERSKNFLAVHKQLELGGTLYGYVDIDGDVQKLAGGLKNLFTAMAPSQPNMAPLAQQDFDALVKMLGLTDIKAVGVSSVPDGSGFFRNRMFFYTAGERHGLLAGLGGKPAPLKHVKLAPADAAFFAEAEMDLGVVYKTLKDVVTKVAGEPAGSQMEKALAGAGEALTLSLLDLIHGFKGRSAIVLRLDPEKTIRTPGPQGLVLPAFSVVVTVDGIGQVVEPSLQKSPMLRRSESGTQKIYEVAQRLPFEGVAPAFVIDGTQLYFTTSLAFLEQCRAQPSGLAQAPEFQQALAHVGAEGNGLSYVSPRFVERVKQIESLNPNLPHDAKATLSFVLKNLPAANRPLIANRINLDDGILVRAHMNRSFKQEMAGAAMYPVGIVAAMAIPAFQKTRTASQEKAVMNNLRQLAAAAEQYYLEHGVTTATYDQLVGPTRYVKAITPVAGENYRALRFVQGQPLRVRLASGKTVEYAP